MLSSIKKIYRAVKYTFFTTRENEYLFFHKKRKYSLLKNYEETHSVKKLQIGAQSNSIRDWLNVDIHPKELTVAYMDATETFPLTNNSFDYVFSEHMIEHITFEEGLFMLRECYRILKPGGKIRIATPNLHSIVNVFLHPHTDGNMAYIKFYIDRFCAEKELPYDPVHVVNTLFYEFGHRFIYTETALVFALEKAGFSLIKKCNVGESDDLHLRNVEQHAMEIGVQNNALETIIVEAVKK